MKKVLGLLSFLLLLVTPVMANSTVYHVNYIYRMYNPITGEHLFTSSKEEALNLVSNKWWQEEDTWTAIDGYGTPIYRLYNAGLDDHLYTSSREEINMLLQNGWVADCNMTPVFYSYGTIPIYRLYNPGLGRHLLTVNEGEYNALAAQGDWSPEGIAFYGVEHHINPNVSHTDYLYCYSFDNVFIDDNGSVTPSSNSDTSSSEPPQYDEGHTSLTYEGWLNSQS